MSYKDKYLKYKQKYKEATGIKKYKDMAGGGKDDYDFWYLLPGKEDALCVPLKELKKDIKWRWITHGHNQDSFTLGYERMFCPVFKTLNEYFDMRAKHLSVNQRKQMIQIVTDFFTHYGAEQDYRIYNTLAADMPKKDILNTPFFKKFNDYLTSKTCDTEFSRQDIFDFLTQANNMSLLTSGENKVDTLKSLFYIMLAFSYKIFNSPGFQDELTNQEPKKFYGICIPKDPNVNHNIGPILALPIALALVHTIME